MWSNQYIVVGDRFSGFCAANSEIVRPESSIVEKIVSLPLPHHPVDLIIEQGADFSNIAAAVREKDPEGRSFRAVPTRRYPRAVKRQAHKNNCENILVSYPVQLTDTRFALEMVLDRSGEMFLDHMTGCHIQGMVLIEAARQSFLAVTEEYYLRDAEDDYYFVIKGINSRFLSFVFPLHTVIDYEVLSYHEKGGRHAFDITVRILQAEEVCAEFDISFTAFPAAVISSKEMEKAGQAVMRTLSASGPLFSASKSPAIAAE
ncbi:AfsA-related hotdog domain-containing protein [Neorhizobium sp. JUb45]|uniref:AfsA-related hotdog domain-containing protein n=1 Tax=unclassified Neorhizobium TaxID=2629175 RepID=UPI0010E28C5A|nr:AfsA-related hotdog domain-containing protein [Neorhizobium sp. JUb45]TCR03025.1 A-factor biosynthesis hotdog protein [Neorhizobium sp. JUb45]